MGILNSFEKRVPLWRTLIIEDRVPQRRFTCYETYKVFQFLVRVNRSGRLTRYLSLHANEGCAHFLMRYRTA